MIRDLMASVEGSYLKGNIREGFERSLYAKLRNALAAVKGQRPDPVACNALTAFSNEVQAQSGKQLTGEQANNRFGPPAISGRGSGGLPGGGPCGRLLAEL